MLPPPDGPTYLFAGGGTGGHLFPGLAVAHELRRRDPTCTILFAGSQRAIESRIVESQGFPHLPLEMESGNMLRRHPLRFLRRFLQALFSARKLIGAHRPAVVVGLGGFASYPLARMAARSGIPVVLLEQNVVAGRATQWLCRRASQICLSFAESLASLPRTTHARAQVTGNPVRPEIAQLTEHTEDESDGTRTILIVGGSQGATAVNDAVLAVAAASEFRDCRFVHQTGERDFERVQAGYQQLGRAATVQAFFDDLPNWYAQADAVIARAGATTLAELACAGCACILVPYPFAAADHQRKNALVLHKQGAALIVEQSTGSNEPPTAQRLTEALRTVLCDDHSRAELRKHIRELARPDATARVAEIIAAASKPA